MHVLAPLSNPVERFSDEHKERLPIRPDVPRTFYAKGVGLFSTRRQNSRPFFLLFPSLLRTSVSSRMSRYNDRKLSEVRGHPEESEYEQPGGHGPSMEKDAGRPRAYSSPRVDWSVVEDGERKYSSPL